MARLTKLTKALHDKLVEEVRTGCTLKVACAVVKVRYGTLARWCHEGKDENNVPQRKLRDDIHAARAEAEQTALRNIQTAGLDPARWQANAWFLEHSIRGRYLKSAVATRPTTNITLSDIARDMENEPVHTNGQTDSHPVTDILLQRSGEIFPADRLDDT